jgi:hypothetical protein
MKFTNPIVYSGDFSAKYNNLSLVHKGYIDTLIATLTPNVHTHTVNDISGLQSILDSLQTALDNKALSSDVQNLQTLLDTLQAEVDVISAYDDSALTTRVTQTETEINNLKSTVTGKANNIHTHTISDVTNLQTTLDGKSSTSHIHTNATTTTAGFMSNTDKTKLNGIADNANNYVHPATHSISEVSGLQTALDSKSTTTHTHTNATTSVAGFMSNTDKSKLDGIAANANNYVHPVNHPASIITQDASNRFVTDSEKTIWNAKASTTVATTTQNGLMASTDKTKLDDLSNYNDTALSNRVTTAESNISDLNTNKADDSVVVKSVNGVLPVNGNVTITSENAVAYDDSELSNRVTTVEGDISTLNSTVANKADKNIATVSTDGLMASTDKVKLDSVADNANNYVHPTTHSISEVSGLQTALDSKGTVKSVNNKVADANGNVTLDGVTVVQGVEPYSESVYIDSKTPWITIVHNFDSFDLTIKYDGQLWNGGVEYLDSNSVMLSGIAGTFLIEITANDKPSSSVTYNPAPHTHDAATTSKAGLMSSTDKTKLNGIAANANNYVHPATHSISEVSGLQAALDSKGTGTVKTVNGISPNAQGDVTVAAGGGGGGGSSNDFDEFDIFDNGVGIYRGVSYLGTSTSLATTNASVVATGTSGIAYNYEWLIGRHIKFTTNTNANSKGGLYFGSMPPISLVGEVIFRCRFALDSSVNYTTDTNIIAGLYSSNLLAPLDASYSPTFGTICLWYNSSLHTGWHLLLQEPNVSASAPRTSYPLVDSLGNNIAFYNDAIYTFNLIYNRATNQVKVRFIAQRTVSGGDSENARLGDKYVSEMTQTYNNTKVFISQAGVGVATIGGATTAKTILFDSMATKVITFKK